MNYELPTKLKIGSRDYRINADFRTALDIFEVLNDPELSRGEQIWLALGFFYPEAAEIPTGDLTEAAEQCFRFLAGGREQKGGPVLMDWERDFQWIVGPVNRVVGKEIRSEEFFHWWSFLGAYMEMGDCLFAQIVRIRSRRAAGKKLDKADEEWYRQNRELVELPQKCTGEEKELLKLWGGG